MINNLSTLKITFDISSSAIGFALLKQTLNETQISFSDAISFKTKDDDFTKLTKINSYFDLLDSNFIKNVDNIIVIAETPYVIFKGSKAFARQKEFLGIVKALFWNHFIKDKKDIKFNWYQIQSNQWQNFFNFKTIKKENNIDYKTLSIQVANETSTKIITDDNEADAFNMLSKFDIIIENINTKSLSKRNHAQNPTN